MKYIINFGYGEYYSGSDYNFNEGKCAGAVGKSFAKRYNTHAKAEHTMNRLIRTCVNATNAEIEEVEE